MGKNNIVFDLDNTLMDFKYTEEYAISCIYDYLKLPYQPSEYDKFYEFQLKFWYNFENSNQEIESSELSKIDYIRSKLYVDYFKELNIPIKLGYELMQLYIDKLGVKNQLYEGVVEILEYLVNKYKLFIGSNGPTASQIRKLTNTNILKYFQKIITAEDIGYAKPSPYFFNGMLESFNIQANDTILIGDSLSSDISGAKNSNIYSIWYNRNGINNTTSIEPDIEIHDLLELKRIL